jgi:P-type conjugative transfer protein TrbG
MRRQVAMGGVLAMGLWGCTLKPAVVPEQTEGPVVQQVACQEPPPKILEVPVPVPMPCQLKPEPTFQPVPGGRKGGKGKSAGLQRVSVAPPDARQGPSTAAGVNAMQQYQYMPGALYQVYGTLTGVTTILLQPGEKATTHAWGDKEAWEIAQTSTGSPEGERQAFLVKPKLLDRMTTLTIATNRRLYVMELHATAATYHAVVSWTYPPEAGMAVRNAGQDPGSTPDPAPERLIDYCLEQATRMNFAYTMEANKKRPRWFPVRVCDDKQKTYIKFPADLATTDAPVLFLRSAEETLALVNYRATNNQYYIVDRLFESAELRVGEKRPIIVKITKTMEEGR